MKVYFYVQLGDSYEAVFSLKFAYRESFTLGFCKHANVSELTCQCETQLRSVSIFSSLTEVDFNIV